MIKRNPTRNSSSNAKKPELKRWRTYLVMAICCLLLVCGFFFAGRQHFSSMDFGMKNAKLRKQVDELEAEKRRLILAREVSLSPVEIKKAAKKAGMADPASVQGEVAQVASSTREKATPPQVSESKSMIVKTAAVSPVATRIAAVYTRTDRPEKKTTSAE